MKRGSKDSSGDEYKKVIESVKDYIFQRHRLPQVTDISERTGIAKSRCSDICKQLIGQKQLYEAFGGPSLPTVILPYDMMQAILRIQSKPNWMNKYSIEEKSELDSKIATLNSKVTEYEMFERLLYTTDIPLEEAVAFVLELLGFEDVVHYKEDKDNPDITFIYEGVKALVEIEGTTKAADKSKAQQLGTWINREIVNSGKKANELKGFLVVNHFRALDPESRGEPLTAHAKEILKLYQSAFFTTYFLCKTVKHVMTGLSKEEARKKVWEGEKID